MTIDPFPGVLTAQTVDRPFTTKTGKAGCQRVKAWVLTDEQRAWLCKWFPEEENSRLIAASGMKHSTLHRFARELGLTKSEKGIKRIKHRQAAHIKRVCEKNGYYASMRGHRPSEACQRATAQMWQDIRDGKREHPARIMKRKNPRKYRQWMKRRSDSRKELIRKEIRRELYGMQRQTKLRCIVLCKYTKSQVSHRYNALKRGYIIFDDNSEKGGERYNIYYDDLTERTPIFEKNLKKDGFNVMKYEQVQDKDSAAVREWI
jgi:hypothetical protein